MGISTYAAIYVGLPRNQLSDLDEFEDWMDNEDIHSCPPQYDGNDLNYAIHGIEVASAGTPCELPEDLLQRIVQATADFKKLTGLDGKVYLSPYIC